MRVYSNFIYNCNNLGTNQMSINQSKNKQNDILLSNKKKKATGTCNEMNFKSIMLSEGCQTQKATYCMILFI